MTKMNKNKGFKVKNKKKASMGNPERRMVVSSGPNFGAKASAMMSRAPQHALDAGGVQYLKLLNDPCNAAFTGPAYEGEGSGLFFRTRTLVTASGCSDSVIQLCPSFIHDNYVGRATPTSAYPENSPVMWSGAGVTGAAFTNVVSVGVAKGLFGHTLTATPPATGVTTVGGSFGTARAIAACIKVGYSGSVMNLSGRVFAKIGTQQVFSEANGGVIGNDFNFFMSDCPQIDDLRSRVHEYRWVPAFDDQSFLQTPAGRLTSGDTQVTADSVNKQGQVLTVGVLGAPSGTITYEVTVVWEVNVAAGASSDLLTSTVAPSTGSTLNHILQTIGNVGQWALSGKGQEQITGMFQGA